MEIEITSSYHFKQLLDKGHNNFAYKYPADWEFGGLAPNMTKIPFSTTISAIYNWLEDDGYNYHTGRGITYYCTDYTAHEFMEDPRNGSNS